MILFLFLFVQVRHGLITFDRSGIQYQLIEGRFQSDVIQRLGTLERQVVVIGYFNTHDFWHGALYESLLHAYKPRSRYPDKPPIDTGVYLNHIRQGGTLSPPVPANSLAPSSWPDGYLAGYISFGYLGLILISIFSGALFGFFYRLVRLTHFAIGPVIIYGMFGFMGAIPLSPLGIIQMLLIIIPVSILGWLCSIGIYQSRARYQRACNAPSSAL